MSSAVSSSRLAAAACRRGVDARVTLLSSDVRDATDLEVEDAMEGLHRALSGHWSTTGITAGKPQSNSPYSAATTKDSLITPWRSPNP
jgi:hypothetical protein